VIRSPQLRSGPLFSFATIIYQVPKDEKGSFKIRGKTDRERAEGNGRYTCESRDDTHVGLSPMRRVTAGGNRFGRDEAGRPAGRTARRNCCDARRCSRCSQSGSASSAPAKFVVARRASRGLRRRPRRRRSPTLSLPPHSFALLLLRTGPHLPARILADRDGGRFPAAGKVASVTATA